MQFFFVQKALFLSTVGFETVSYTHLDTFQPRNGTQTSVLILQRKTQEQKDTEEKSGKMADYNIFMAMIEKMCIRDSFLTIHCPAPLTQPAASRNKMGNITGKG